MANRDPAAEQLMSYKNSKAKVPRGKRFITSAFGTRLVDKDVSLTVGRHGPILLHDVQLVEELAHFVRERIPERVIHAKGAGAFGYFEVLDDKISQFTSAKVFAQKGKKTPIVVRFSTSTGDAGSPEAARDTKGMAVKFQTDDGILDIIGNNHPVFYIREPALFPSLIHASKRNPRTHLPDADMVWDFMSLRPETTNQLLHLFSEQGIPNGWRRMHSYSINVFKLVKSGKFVYCKFRFHCLQDLQYLTDDQASKVDPDHFSRDLYNAIESGVFPAWELKVQIMHEQQVIRNEKVKGNDTFDPTKEWPADLMNEITVGRIYLNRNPMNYFAEIEQLAFSPSNLVPGIEPSPYDRLLMARMFAYPDAQRHRLGANYQQLGANRPLQDVKNFQRDGGQTFFYQGDDPVYHPNSYGGPDSLDILESRTQLSFTSTDIGRFELPYDNFVQPGKYFRSLTENQKNVLAVNLSKALSQAHPSIQARMLKNFASVDSQLHDKVKARLGRF